MEGLIKNTISFMTLDIVQTLPIIRTYFDIALESAELAKQIFLDTSLAGWILLNMTSVFS